MSKYCLVHFILRNSIFWFLLLLIAFISLPVYAESVYSDSDYYAIENEQSLQNNDYQHNGTAEKIYFNYTNNPGTDLLVVLLYVLVFLVVFFILFKIHFFLGVIVLVGGTGLFVYDMVRYDSDYKNIHLKAIPLIMGAIVCWYFYKNTYGQD